MDESSVIRNLLGLGIDEDNDKYAIRIIGSNNFFSPFITLKRTKKNHNVYINEVTNIKNGLIYFLKNTHDDELAKTADKFIITIFRGPEVWIKWPIETITYDGERTLEEIIKKCILDRHCLLFTKLPNDIVRVLYEQYL